MVNLCLTHEFKIKKKKPSESYAFIILLVLLHKGKRLHNLSSHFIEFGALYGKFQKMKFGGLDINIKCNNH